MIVATLLLKDEEEILEEWFEHHLNEGIDKFIITDNNSTDNSRKIIQKYEKYIELIIDELSEGYLQDILVTRMAYEAIKSNPKWIVHMDADEFWSGFENLRNIPEDVGLVVSDDWINHFPHEDISYSKFTKDQIPYYELNSGVAPSYPIYSFYGYFRNSRKIIHRPCPNITICPGNHKAINFNGEITGNIGIKIHHYPIRYYRQFENKVIRGGNMMLHSDYPDHVNSHWREWYKIYLKKDLKEIYHKIINTAKGTSIIL